MPKITPDVTLWMTDELHKVLTKIIMAKEDLSRIYYILVIMNDIYMGPPAARDNDLINPGGPGTKTMDLSGKFVIHNTIVLMNTPPVVPLLSTSLWRIDNKIGEARCEYILPPDKPLITGDQMGEASKFIWKSAKGAPLVYSNNN